MNHQGTKTLESERLILRRFRLDDAPFMFENWANDPDVTKYLMWPRHESVDVSKGVLTEWTNKYDNKDFYEWAVTVKENGDIPIGSISVVDKNETAMTAHIGYCIGKKWWNKGITSEALKTVMSFLFNQVKVNRIDSRHDPRNPNSGKVMMKCGMKYEGTLRESDYNNQGICDASHYAILAKEYYSQA